MRRWMWMAGWMLLVVISGNVRATTFGEKEFVCPACGGKVIGGQLTSTNSVATDSDFCKHAAGEQPNRIRPITCPKCYYSGYGNDFAATVTLTNEQKDKLRQSLKPMRPIGPGTRSLQIRACVRYDLIAQTLRTLGADDGKVGDAYLQASWAERLEYTPSMRLSGPTRESVKGLWDKLVKAVPPAADGEEEVSWAERDIRLGRELRRMAGGITAAESLAALVMAVDRLRDHGEYAEIRLTVAALKGKLPEAEYAEYVKGLDESMELEKLFQGRAADVLEGWIKQEKDADERMALTYLCGELRWRRGETEAAEKFFAAAAKMEGPEDLKQWMKRQQKRRETERADRGIGK